MEISLSIYFISESVVTFLDEPVHVKYKSSTVRAHILCKF